MTRNIVWAIFFIGFILSALIGYSSALTCHKCYPDMDTGVQQCDVVECSEDETCVKLLPVVQSGCIPIEFLEEHGIKEECGVVYASKLREKLLAYRDPNMENFTAILQDPFATELDKNNAQDVLNAYQNQLNWQLKQFRDQRLCQCNTDFCNGDSFGENY